MKKIKLNVEGMHCKSCEMLVNDAIEELNGVIKVKSDHESGIVEVEFDENKLPIDKIKQVIRGEGYKIE